MLSKPRRQASPGLLETRFSHVEGMKFRDGFGGGFSPRNPGDIYKSQKTKRFSDQCWPCSRQCLKFWAALSSPKQISIAYP